jgi:50S ribosomal protein L16 3-hydroxylase
VKLALLGGLTAREFLERHWQKRPLLVRGAFPDFRDPLTPARLAALACSRDVESRLVLARGGDRPWQVVDGPQDPRRLRRLPPGHWTLLVQDVDKHVAAVARLREAVSFVPSWRLDDVMVSFATRFGTVGPHVDSYDVFLVQGRGRRRWQIDPRAAEDYRPGLDLRVLRRFRPRAAWVLEPGDLLYLPPGVAHYGVALTDCLTYSIGFRAPSQAEVVGGFVQRLLARADDARRYRDPELVPPRHPGAIPGSAVARLREMVAGPWRRLAGRAFEVFVGELLTEPKGPLGRRRGVAAAAFRRRLAASAALVPAPAARVAFLRRGGRAVLFANGRAFPLSPALAFAAPLLASGRSVDAAVIRRHARRPGFLALLRGMVAAGAFTLAGGRAAAARGRPRSPRDTGSRSSPARR